jgi:electron transfer flavoprotein alpha/beta subunit
MSPGLERPRVVRSRGVPAGLTADPKDLVLLGCEVADSRQGMLAARAASWEDYYSYAVLVGAVGGLAVRLPRETHSGVPSCCHGLGV